MTFSYNLMAPPSVELFSWSYGRLFKLKFFAAVQYMQSNKLTWYWRRFDTENSWARSWIENCGKMDAQVFRICTEVAVQSRCKQPRSTPLDHYTSSSLLPILSTVLSLQEWVLFGTDILMFRPFFPRTKRRRWNKVSTSPRRGRRHGTRKGRCHVFVWTNMTAALCQFWIL